ncbi:MAG: TetR/AcrR family transcriptional regulator C-terminal domain-containing protein [Actinoallomurus sp.]
MIVLGHYVSGFVLDEQGDAGRTGEEAPALDSAEFPILTAGGGAVLDRDTLFEYGLQRMLDGMRAQLRGAVNDAVNDARHP